MESTNVGHSITKKRISPKPRRPLKQTAISQSDTLDDNDCSKHKSTESSLHEESFERQHINSSNTSTENETTVTEEELQITSTPKNHTSVNSVLKNNNRTSKGDPSNNGFSIGSLYTFIVLCAIPLLYVYFIHGTEQDEFSMSIETSLSTLKESMDSIQKQFNEQDSHIWEDISSGLSDVIEQANKLSIFILLSSESETMNCLAASLGRLCSQVLGTNDYLTLTPRNIGNNTGEVLSTFKDKILTRKVVVVQNLLNMNAKAVEAFHNLCDRENPLIEHTIYIITILSESHKSKFALPFVEALISNKLSGLVDQDKIAPLVTRITDGLIIEVQPEQHMTKCSLSQ